jgi:acetyl-CoA/propionyl-CoA carboxylase carboxyl transferase subunit
MTDLKDKFDELTRLREQAKLGGGEERIKKEHEKGRLTARERLDKLQAQGSFMEMDEFVVYHDTESGL